MSIGNEIGRLEVKKILAAEFRPDRGELQSETPEAGKGRRARAAGGFGNAFKDLVSAAMRVRDIRAVVYTITSARCAISMASRASRGSGCLRRR